MKQPSQTMALGATLLSIAFMLAMGTIAVELGGRVNAQLVILSRTLIGLLAAAGLAIALRIPLPIRAGRALWTRSLLGAIGIQFTYYAFLTLPLSTSTTIFHTTPVWSALLTWFFLGTKLSKLQVAAILVCVAGVFGVYQPSIEVSGVSMVSAVLSALFAALAIISMSRMGSIPSLQIVVHSSALSAIGAFLVLISTQRLTVLSEVNKLTSSLAILLVLLGLFGCAGQLLITFACKGLSPIVSSTLRVIEIPLAMLVTAFTRPNPFTLMELIGGGFVAIGASTLTIYSLPAMPSLVARSPIPRNKEDELTQFTNR